MGERAEIPLGYCRANRGSGTPGREELGVKERTHPQFGAPIHAAPPRPTPPPHPVPAARRRRETQPRARSPTPPQGPRPLQALPRPVHSATPPSTLEPWHGPLSKTPSKEAGPNGRPAPSKGMRHPTATGQTDPLKDPHPFSKSPGTLLSTPFLPRPDSFSFSSSFQSFIKGPRH